MPILTVARTVTGATPAAMATALTSDTILAISGWEIAGTMGGLVAGIGGLVGTYIALRANARTARREYQQELQASYQKGIEDAKRVLDPQLDLARQRAADIQASLSERVKELNDDVRYWREQARGGNNP